MQGHRIWSLPFLVWCFCSCCTARGWGIFPVKTKFHTDVQNLSRGVCGVIEYGKQPFSLLFPLTSPLAEALCPLSSRQIQINKTTMADIPRPQYQSQWSCRCPISFPSVILTYGNQDCRTVKADNANAAALRDGLPGGLIIFFGQSDKVDNLDNCPSPFENLLQSQTQQISLIELVILLQSCLLHADSLNSFVS